MSADIGSLVCKREYGVWAKEFDKDIAFQLKERICAGAEECVFSFSR